MRRKGFTIVELVIVIAVIAILAAVLIPTFSGIVTKAQESAAMQTARNAYMVYLADPDVAKAQTKDDDYIIVVGDYLFTVIDCQFYETAYTVAEDSTDTNNGDKYSVVTLNNVTTITVDNGNSDFATGDYVSYSYSDYYAFDKKTPDNITKYTLYKLSNTATEGQCFAAGTQITMADGTKKNIEDIVVGDTVLSYDISKQETYETVVLETFKHTSTAICTITLTDGTTVECTPTHPLLTTEGFKSVIPDYIDVMKEYPSTELNVGDMVITENGTVAVASITTEQKAVDVYSFHVESNGDVRNCTYFADGIVAHNPGGC